MRRVVPEPGEEFDGIEVLTLAFEDDFRLLQRAKNSIVMPFVAQPWNLSIGPFSCPARSGLHTGGRNPLPPSLGHNLGCTIKDMRVDIARALASAIGPARYDFPISNRGAQYCLASPRRTLREGAPSHG